MNDIKKMFSFAVALSFVIFNMTSLGVAAEIDDTIVSSETVYEEVTDSTVQINYQISDELSESADSVNDEVAENSEQLTDDGAENSEQLTDDGADEQLAAQKEIYSDSQNEQETDNNSDDDRVFFVNTGDGTVEDIVNTNVFQITFPVEEHIIDYVADPQKLIYQTKEQAHENEDYDDNSNVFFNNGKIVNSNGETVTRYSNTSNPLTIVNKSSCPVNVIASVRAYYDQDGNNRVILSPDREWENIKAPSIYLSVIDSDSNETVISQNEKVITSTIPGCPEAYKYVYEEDRSGTMAYNYRLMDENELKESGFSDMSFSEYSLRVYGECSDNGKWEHRVDYDFPSILVVWNVGFVAASGPYINDTNYCVAFDNEFEIPFCKGTFDLAASEVESLEYISDSGEKKTLKDNEEYCSIYDDSIFITSEFAAYAHSLNGGVLKVKFNDVKNTEFSINLDPNSVPFLIEKEIEISSNSTELKIHYNIGSGEKSASTISSIKFAKSDFSSSAHCSIDNGEITFTKSAIRDIVIKGGGIVSVVFDDSVHTRCGVSIKVK